MSASTSVAVNPPPIEESNASEDSAMDNEISRILSRVREQNNGLLYPSNTFSSEGEQATCLPNSSNLDNVPPTFPLVDGSQSYTSLFGTTNKSLEHMVKNTNAQDGLIPERPNLPEIVPLDTPQLLMAFHDVNGWQLDGSIVTLPVTLVKSSELRRNSSASDLPSTSHLPQRSLDDNGSSNSSTATAERPLPTTEVNSLHSCSVGEAASTDRCSFSDSALNSSCGKMDASSTAYPFSDLSGGNKNESKAQKDTYVVDAQDFSCLREKLLLSRMKKNIDELHSLSADILHSTRAKNDSSPVDAHHESVISFDDFIYSHKTDTFLYTFLKSTSTWRTRTKAVNGAKPSEDFLFMVMIDMIFNVIDNYDEFSAELEAGLYSDQLLNPIDACIARIRLAIALIKYQHFQMLHMPESLRFEYGYQYDQITEFSTSQYLFIAEDEKRRAFLTVKAARKQVENHSECEDLDHQIRVYKQTIERERSRIIEHEEAMRRKLSPWLREQLPHLFDQMALSEFARSADVAKEITEYLTLAEHPDSNKYASWRDLETLHVILARVRSFLDRRLTTYDRSKQMKFKDAYQSAMRQEREVRQHLAKKYRFYPHAVLAYDRCYEIFIISRADIASRIAVMFLMANIQSFMESLRQSCKGLWSVLGIYVIGFICLFFRVFFRFTSRLRWSRFFSRSHQLHQKEDNLLFSQLFGFLERIFDRLAGCFLAQEVVVAFSQVETFVLIFLRSKKQESQKNAQTLNAQHDNLQTLANVRVRSPRFRLVWPTRTGRLPVLRRVPNSVDGTPEESLQSRNVRQAMVGDVQGASSAIQEQLNNGTANVEIPVDSCEDSVLGRTDLNPSELATNSTFSQQETSPTSFVFMDDQAILKEQMHKANRWTRFFSSVFYEGVNGFKFFGALCTAVSLTFHLSLTFYRYSDKDMFRVREREISFGYVSLCIAIELLALLLVMAIIVFILPRMEQRLASQKLQLESRQHMLTLHSSLLHSFSQKNVGRLLYLRTMELRDDTYFVFNNLHVFSHPEIIKEYFDEIDRAFPADKLVKDFVESKARLALYFLIEHQACSVNPYLAVKRRYDAECNSYVNFEWFSSLFSFQETSPTDSSIDMAHCETSSTSTFAASPTGDLDRENSSASLSSNVTWADIENDILRRETNSVLKKVALQRENRSPNERSSHIPRTISDASRLNQQTSDVHVHQARNDSASQKSTVNPNLNPSNTGSGSLHSSAKPFCVQGVQELLQESLAILQWRHSEKASNQTASGKVSVNETLDLLKKQLQMAINFVISMPNNVWLTHSKYADSWQKADLWVTLVVLHWISSGQEKYASIMMQWFVSILELRHSRALNMSHPKHSHVNVEYAWDPVNKNMLHYDENSSDTRRAVKLSRPPWKVLGKLVCPQSIAEADFSEYVVQLLAHFDKTVGDKNILDQAFVDIPRSKWLDRKFAAQWTLSAISRAHERAFCLDDLLSILHKYSSDKMEVKNLTMFKEPYPMSKIYTSTDSTTPKQFVQFAQLASRLYDPHRTVAERETEILVMAHLLQTAYTSILQRPGFAHYSTFHSWDFAYRQSNRLRAKVIQYRVKPIVDAQENGQYIREQKADYLDKLKAAMVDEVKSSNAANQRKALLKIVKMYKSGQFREIPVMSIESRKEYDHRQILYVQDLMRRRQRIPGGISQRVYHIATQTLKDEHMKNDDTLTKPFRPIMTFLGAEDIFDEDEDDETSLGKLFPQLALKKPASPPSNSSNAQQPASNSASSSASSSSTSASASSSASSSSPSSSAGRAESERGESSTRRNDRSNNHPYSSIPAPLVYNVHYPIPYIPRITRSLERPVRVDAAVLHPFNMDKVFLTYKKEFRDFRKRHAAHFLDDTRVNARITVEARPFQANALKMEDLPGLPLISFDLFSRWSRKRRNTSDSKSSNDNNDDDVAREADIIRDEFLEAHAKRREEAEKNKLAEDPSESISSALRSDFVNETHRLENRLKMIIRQLCGDDYHPNYIYGYKLMSEIYREQIESELDARAKAANKDAEHNSFEAYRKKRRDAAKKRAAKKMAASNLSRARYAKNVAANSPPATADKPSTSTAEQATPNMVEGAQDNSPALSAQQNQHNTSSQTTPGIASASENPLQEGNESAEPAEDTSDDDNPEVLYSQYRVKEESKRLELMEIRQRNRAEREKRWKENVRRRMIPDSIQGEESRRVYGDYVMMKKIVDDALDQLKIKEALDAGKQLTKEHVWKAKDSFWYNYNKRFNKRIDYDCIMDHDGDKNHIVLEENAPPLDAPCHRHRKQAIRYILRRNGTPYFDPYWPRNQPKSLTYPMAAALLRETASATESEEEDTVPAEKIKAKSTQGNETKYTVKNADNDDTDDEYNRYYHECDPQPSFYKDTDICALEATYKLSAYKRPKTDAAIRRAACRELVRHELESAPPPEIVRIPNRWWCGVRDFFWRCWFTTRCSWKYLMLNWDGRIPIALLRGVLVALTRVFWRFILEGKVFERSMTNTDEVLGVFVFTHSYLNVLVLSSASLMICGAFEMVFDIVATHLYESSVEYWIHSNYADCMMSYFVDIFIWDSWRNVPDTNQALSILCYIGVTLGYLGYNWGFREDARLRRAKESRDNDQLLRELLFGKDLGFIPSTMWQPMDWRNLRENVNNEMVSMQNFFYEDRYGAMEYRKQTF